MINHYLWKEIVSQSFNQPFDMQFTLLLVIRVLVKGAVLMLVFYQYRPLHEPRKH